MKSSRKLCCVLASSLLLGLSACHDGGGGGGGTVVPGTRTPPGGPVAGLTADELAAFERGKDVFVRRFKPSEGLGPLYNATSCESCHSTPAIGGSAPLYRNFYLAMWEDAGRQVPLPPFVSAVVSAYGAGPTFTLAAGRNVIPSDVNGSPVVVAQRNALPIFGVGLFEFVTNDTIFSMADPDDLDGDGISGRYNTDNGAVGRLGVKSQSNNIEAFTRAPLRNQMGITNNPFLGSAGTVSLGMPQVTTDPDRPLTDQDGIPDPEISTDDLGDLIAFTRFLAPVEPLAFDEAATRGEATFDAIGCTKCHVPELPTSRFGTIRPYTDLLIHDMGPDLADGLGLGLPQFSSLSPGGTHSEFRTQPLWGVSLSAPFLHDGRAETLREAIELHAGEAQAIRDAFVALAAADQDDVIAFLEHL